VWNKCIVWNKCLDCFSWKADGKRRLAKSRYRWQDKVLILKQVHKIVLDCIYLGNQWLTPVIMAMKRWIP